MSKTFKCVEHEEEVLEVYSFPGEEAWRRFTLLLPHVSPDEGIAFDSTTAPALALAILEAAGVAESSDAGVSAQYLRAHIAEHERATAEAEAQAKLEAEALEFLHVAQKHNNFPLTESWADFRDGGTKLLYMNMARRARELNKDENNA